MLIFNFGVKVSHAKSDNEMYGSSLFKYSDEILTSEFKFMGSEQGSIKCPFLSFPVIVRKIFVLF